MKTLPAELIFAQTEEYTEYGRDGKKAVQAIRQEMRLSLAAGGGASKATVAILPLSLSWV